MAKFITPPENQGQIVEVSYAAVGNEVIRRTHDQSDKSTEYAASKALNGDEGDYWNGAPANKRWRTITADEAMRLIVDE